MEENQTLLETVLEVSIHLECGRGTFDHLLRKTIIIANMPQSNTGDVLSRIQRLEEAVFQASNHESSSILGTVSEGNDRHSKAHVSLASPRPASPEHGSTPFSSHDLDMMREMPADTSEFVANLLNKLPPLDEARLLFDHFSLALHPTFGVLHLPSTRTTMEETFHRASNGDTEICMANILMLFSIFAGAALSWTTQFLSKLRALRKEARAAFKMYARLAMSILEHCPEKFPTSTPALAAVTTLAFVVSNASFSLFDVNMLRCRCMLMAKAMQIDRLDTFKSREERRLKGYNTVEIEVQRRIWWHMVSSDW